MYVYLITNKVNGFYYVGKRTIPSSSSDYHRYYGSGVKIRKAIEIFGKENFEKIILQECDDKASLAEMESIWLKKILVERGRDTCYNISLDCNNAGINKGHKQSKEHIENRVSSRKEKGNYKWTEEQRKNKSKAKKGIPGNDKGKHYENKRLVKLGKNNPCSKKVINSESGEVFDCIEDAAKYLGIKHGTLWQYLRGKRKNKTKMILYEEIR